MKPCFNSLRQATTGAFTAICAAAAMACSAQTSTLTSGVISPITTNWATALTVPQFNPTLGSLTQVVVTLNWTTTQTVSVSNSDKSGKINPMTGTTYPPGMLQEVYADESVNVMLTYPSGGSLTGGLLVGAPPDITLGSQDPIFLNATGPLPANTTQSNGPVTTTLTTVSTAITDNATLALYTGFGNVSFGTSGNGLDTLQDSGGNVVWTASTLAGASVTVTYTYTPGSHTPPPNTGPFVTYTQGGWGTSPHGQNPGYYLTKYFSTVLPGGIYIGNPSGNNFFFDSAAAIEAFLPQGGPDKVLPTGSTTDPTGKAGNITGQLLSVELSVAFSDAGIFGSGLGSLTIQSGPLKGFTVYDAINAGNALLGGTAYPAGVPVLSLSNLDTVLTNITSAYDNGTSNTGYIK